MKTLDLVPPDVAARRATRSRLRKWAARLALSVIGAACAYAALNALVAGQSDELQKLTVKHGELECRLRKAGTILTERDRLARNYEAIAVVAGSSRTDEIMCAIESALTPESYLSFLQMDRSPAAVREPAGDVSANARQGSLRMRGFAPGHGHVGQIIQRLMGSGLFSEVALAWTMDASAEDGRSKIEFEVECTLRDGARLAAAHEADSTEDGA